MKNNKKGSNEKKITAKQASDKAMSHFWELYGEKIPLQVEETEMNEDGKNWLITLSYEEHDPSINLIFAKKVYKIFKINAITGKVISMKIRKI